jgi:RNA polymerase sigma-70 factor (ECF subfamily)
MEEYRKRVFNLLLGMLQSEDTAEELTQEVLFRAEQSLPKLREKKALSSWIYRIAVNSAIDYLRRKKRIISLDDMPESGFSPDLDDAISEKEISWCVKNRIEELPAIYKTVLIMAEIEGLKQKEIANILSISLSTVKMRLHRARRMLKSKVEEVCDVEKKDGELSCIPKKDACC